MDKDELLKRICKVEEDLKYRELSRISGKREVDSATFFRISYKLQVLARMKEWLDLYGNLPRSYRWMLRNPNEPWG